MSQQEHFRGKVIRRFLSPAEFDAFCDKYNDYKGYGIMRQYVGKPKVLKGQLDKVVTYFEGEK